MLSTPDFRAFLIHDGKAILEGASEELVNDPIAPINAAFHRSRSKTVFDRAS